MASVPSSEWPVNRNHLQAVPTVDQMLSNPAKVANLTPEAARIILGELAGLLPALVAQASRESPKVDSLSPPERWLSVTEASEMFGVKARWLRSHKDRLPHSKPSHKVLLFPEEKLRKWFAAHRAN